MNQRVKVFFIFFITLPCAPILRAHPTARVLPPETGYITNIKKNKAKLVADTRPEKNTADSSAAIIDVEAVKEKPAVRNLIAYLMAQKEKLQGGAVAIIHKGSVIYSHTFGYEKADSSQCITSHTLFPLASLSKPVAAVAVALLVEKGKLNFKQRFELPYLKQPVTLKHILSHTTGYAFSGNAQIEQGIDRAELLRKIDEQKPHGQPGYYYSYSNTLFSMLEEALGAKKIKLDALLSILRKSLQTNEITLLPRETDRSVAYRHLAEKNGDQDYFKSLPFISHYAKTVPAAAGIFASLEAMIKVFQLSFGYKTQLITAKTLDKLYRIGIPNHDMDKWNISSLFPTIKLECYYGLGWRILKAIDYPGQDLIFHNGFLAGVSTYIGFMPAQEIGVIMLFNQQSRVPLEKGLQFWVDCLVPPASKEVQ